MRLHPLARGLAVTLLFALPALPAMAARFELQVGRSYMDNYGTTAVFAEGVFNDYAIGNSQFTWAPDVTAGWIKGRALMRFDLYRPNTRDDSGIVAAGARFHYGAADAWYRPLFFSFQPALHSGRTMALSSSYEFVSTLGWQGKHWSVEMRHISNGGFHNPNRGETMALVGVAF